jgi:hypothetical protein
MSKIWQNKRYSIGENEERMNVKFSIGDHIHFNSTNFDPGKY